jgi:hypothetical protein
VQADVDPPLGVEQSEYGWTTHFRVSPVVIDPNEFGFLAGMVTVVTPWNKQNPVRLS